MGISSVAAVIYHYSWDSTNEDVDQDVENLLVMSTSMTNVALDDRNV